MGYQFIDRDTTSLIARFGAGVSHEIGGPDDAYVPELVYGLDFDHQFSDRQKLTLTADYTPDVTAIGAAIKHVLFVLVGPRRERQRGLVEIERLGGQQVAR